jgi:hypothetical protein
MPLADHVQQQVIPVGFSASQWSSSPIKITGKRPCAAVANSCVISVVMALAYCGRPQRRSFKRGMNRRAQTTASKIILTTRKITFRRFCLWRCSTCRASSKMVSKRGFYVSRCIPADRRICTSFSSTERTIRNQSLTFDKKLLTFSENHTHVSGPCWYTCPCWCPSLPNGCDRHDTDCHSALPDGAGYPG